MTEGTLKINTEKLLPIIKKWLYSDKEIFLRELVSNACDALSKLKILREQGEIEFSDDELKIDIRLDAEAKTLTISDTGIGMTAEEVEKYIAQLAFSGAEDFLSKYEGSEEKNQVIGHFGLGFYSAYMVSSKVEIDTLSYQERAEPAHWVCDGTSSYTLDKGTRAERGTTITLHIEDEDFLEEARIASLLSRYCAFLPYPIHLEGEHINHKDPLWLKSPADCTEEEYLEFYRQLHPMEPEPIFWVHLNVDYPFHLKGILYFPHIHNRFDFQKKPVKLFCNRVFVSDNCSDLIPEYLSIMRGAIDSPDIPLNVSRSYLQMDKTVRSLSNHIAKKVADRLSTGQRKISLSSTGKISRRSSSSASCTMKNSTIA
jgi:molecular chaperone HtpG